MKNRCAPTASRPRRDTPWPAWECNTGYLLRLTDHLADLEPPLRLMLCDVIWEKDTAFLTICLPVDQAPRLDEALEATGGPAQGIEEVIFVNLQGPHFGDRWGIAKEALVALEESRVEPKALLGVTHTLQLILNPATSQEALAGLENHFSSPEISHA